MTAGPEGWLDWVEQDPRRIRELYEAAPPDVQVVMELLAERAPARLAYRDIADTLGWSPHKWPGTFETWKRALMKRGEYTRPWHLCSDKASRSGRWEAWMDVQQAAVLLEPRAARNGEPLVEVKGSNGASASVSKRSAHVVETAAPANGFPAWGAIRYIPSERNVTRRFTVDVSRERDVHRREGELVELYEQHLDELEIEHGRLEMPVEDTKLYNDIYVPDRHQLIEAKGGVRRELIRMAIGQLADYAFQMSKDPGFERPPSAAVLLPQRPSGAIEELLDSQGVAAVWATADGFADNRGGVFT